MDLVAFRTRLLHKHIKDPLLGVMKCNLLIGEIRQYESIKQWTSFLDLNIFHGGLYKMAS
ncbi:unnamed protein product [Camellia sinensis]